MLRENIVYKHKGSGEYYRLRRNREKCSWYLTKAYDDQIETLSFLTSDMEKILSNDFILCESDEKDTLITGMLNEVEKLRRLNQFMKERLIWFAENSWNADEACRVHKEALRDLEEFEKEIDNET